MYRGKAVPTLESWYVFGDYVSGQVWAIQQQAGQRTAYVDLSKYLDKQGVGYVPGLASFGEDAAGELYLLSLSGGEIYRLVKAEG